MEKHVSPDSEGGRSTTPLQAAPNDPAAHVAVSATATPSPSPTEPDPAPITWTPSQFKPSTISDAYDNKHQISKTSASEHRKQHNVREYTLGEEIANSITHGFGIIFAIVAIAVLTVRAVGDGGGIYLFAALVYTITMLVEYTMSTLYHALAAEKVKRIFKILDHSCIYLFIAGSYTPFCLITLHNDGGMLLCAFVWAVALIGVACEAFWVFRPRWISAVLYLMLGWCVVAFLPQLTTLLPSTGLWLLVGGGISYSIGCIFYVLKKIPYMHSIFHLWVLAGSILQFVAIAFYVM